MIDVALFYLDLAAFSMQPVIGKCNRSFSFRQVTNQKFCSDNLVEVKIIEKYIVSCHNNSEPKSRI